MKILDFLRAEGIICPLSANSKEEVLKELVEPIVKAHPRVDRDRLLKTLLERESLGSTGIGGGVAIPHGKFEGLDKLASSFGRSPRGIDFSSMDSKPAHIFFLLVAPKNCAGDHLKALARISRLLKDPLLLTSLQKSESPGDIYRVLEEYRSSTAVILTLQAGEVSKDFEAVLLALFRVELERENVIARNRAREFYPVLRVGRYI